MYFKNEEDKKLIEEIFAKEKIEQPKVDNNLYIFDYENPIELKKPSTYSFKGVRGSAVEVTFSNIYEKK